MEKELASGQINEVGNHVETLVRFILLDYKCTDIETSVIWNRNTGDNRIAVFVQAEFPTNELPDDLFDVIRNNCNEFIDNIIY